MLRFGHFASLAVFLVPLTGCPLFYGLLNVPFNLAIESQSNRQAGQLTVIGGNAERAVLAGMSSYFASSNTDELVLLDLATGERSPISIGVEDFNTFLAYGLGAPVQTDGDYIAWRKTDPYVDTRDGIHLLDLRTGEEWQVWEDGQFEGYAVTSWALSAGHVVAETQPLSAPDPFSIVGAAARLIYELATRQTRVVFPSVPPREGVYYEGLVEPAIYGTTAFSIEIVRVTAPNENGDLENMPVESRLVETNLETGEFVARVAYASSADTPYIFASATHVVWRESDYSAERFLVGYYDRITGTFGLIERDYQDFNIPELVAAGDSGFVIRSESGVPFVSWEVRYEFVDFDENVSVLQRRTLGGATIPIEGLAAVLGDRVIWNDPLDGRLRSYVISTGEFGTYDE